MPPTEEMSDAFADVVINGPVCPVARAITEIGRPTAQQTVQLVADICPWLHVAWHQNVIDFRLHPLDTFLGWTCTQVPVAVPLVTMRTERVPEEVEALRSCVLHRGFPLVECQPELRHHRLCPRQRLSRASLTEDNEIIGIVDDVRTERLTAAAASPMLEKALHVDVGKQRTHYSLNAKGNFRFEREIGGWRGGSVVDLRRKR